MLSHDRPASGRPLARASAVAAGLATLVLAARSAEACSCRFPGPSLQEAIAHSDAIFLGKAMKIEWVGRDFEPGHQPGLLPVSRAVTFEVDTQWKGESAAAITVHTGSGGGDCGSSFDVGRDYLVYAGGRDGPAGAILVTSICHRGLAAHREDPRTRYEMDELDQALLGREVPDPETAREREEIRKLYESYRWAVRRLAQAQTSRAWASRVPDGHPHRQVEQEPPATPEQALSFLCNGVVDHYATLRELALHASKEQLLAGSLFTAMDVLALRHRIDGATLSTMTAVELVARFYEAGWEPRPGSIELELGRFGALGDDVYVDGVGGSGSLGPQSRFLEARFRFEKVHGGWCFDSIWNPVSAEAGQTLRYAAPQLGRPLDDYVLELVEGMLQHRGYGQASAPWPVEAGPALWEPLTGLR